MKLDCVYAAATNTALRMSRWTEVFLTNRRRSHTDRRMHRCCASGAATANAAVSDVLPALLMTLLLGACGFQSDGVGQTTPFDNAPILQLREADSFYVGRARDFAVDEQGAFYVADGLAERVLVFGSDGAPLRSFGQRGTGPGELGQIGPIAVSETTVSVVDIADRQIHAYDRQSGILIKSLPYRGMATTLLARGAELWAGDLAIVDAASVSRWNPGDTVPTRFGPFPEAYRQSNPLYSIYNVVSVSFTGSRMVVGLAASNVLWVYEAGSTTPTDSVAIPQKARRGVPPGLAEEIGGLQFEEMFASASVLMGMHALSGGRILLIHYDQEMDRGHVSSSAFGTVLDSALRPVCVDILLRRKDSGQARFTTRGDTLFRFRQLVIDNSARAEISAWKVGGECS